MDAGGLREGCADNSIRWFSAMGKRKKQRGAVRKKWTDNFRPFNENKDARVCKHVTDANVFKIMGRRCAVAVNMDKGVPWREMFAVCFIEGIRVHKGKGRAGKMADSQGVSYSLGKCCFS